MFVKSSTTEDWDNVWQSHNSKESYNYRDSRLERARDKISKFINLVLFLTITIKF